MGSRIQVFLLLVFFQISVLNAFTNNMDFAALMSLKDIWENTPPNWNGTDPCGNGWDGIGCTNSHVTSITLSTMGLMGQLSGDIQFLSELQTLDLSSNKGLTGSLPASIGNLKKLKNLMLVGCSFTGPIPDSIGSLPQLVFISLNSNGFTGRIPPSIGNLSNLYWLDLTDNHLDGPIPVSNGGTPGLDLLVRTKHFHLGQNRLSGTIPPQLFSSNMVLIHVLFDGNHLTGSLPSTLGHVKTLEIIRFDRNSLSGPVPSNLNNLTSVSELFLSNNRLNGPVPNLTGMNPLYVDLSNNSFDASDVPSWFSTLQSLTTLVMEGTQLQGQVPVALFSLPNLKTVILRNNQLSGSLDIGTSNSSQLQLVDLQTNFITVLAPNVGEYNFELILVGNPICEETGAQGSYCTVSQSNNSHSTLPNNCVPIPCTSNQTSSPNCKCAYPYTGTLVFRVPSFLDSKINSSYYIFLENLEKNMMSSFQLNQLPVDSVSVSNPNRDSNDRLILSLEVFPSGGQTTFNRTGISSIGFVLNNNNQTGNPFHFIGNYYGRFSEVPTGSNKSSNIGIIIGAAAGGSVLLLLLLIAGIYAFRQKKRAEKAIDRNNPFAHWDPNKGSGGIPQLKGTTSFSYEELKKYTNNFSEASVIGSGGYGKVYRATLPTGQFIAIKRAQQGSMQGGVEFKSELELLSRVHHKNVVSLLGFCFERSERMLIYEYVPNGTLKDSLSGKSGLRLDWMRRLKVALGAARGVAYLHELANPPIIHRDIKSTNILLDERLNAKVADFGLSKPMNDIEKAHISTQVKGTMGYLDPEYYMTQQLTEKSDVYSFGVLMLELLSARRPLEHGKYIVREVRTAMNKTKDLYNLHELLDPAIGLGTTLKGFEKFVDLAMRCLEELGTDRPTMGAVVKEIENIMQFAGLNPNVDSASTSASYEEVSKEIHHHPYSDEAFGYSGVLPPSKIEPQ